MDRFHLGDYVRVTWTDGDHADGRYKGKDRGFLIIEDRRGRLIPCSPTHIESIKKLSF